MERYKIYNVTQLSIGIDKGDGIIEIIIPKNTLIPFSKPIKFHRIKNNQLLLIYEIENKFIETNYLLGIYFLNDIFSKNNDKNEVEIIFNINLNSALSEQEKIIDNSMKINLKYDKRDKLENKENKKINNESYLKQKKYLKLIQMEKSLIYIFF